MTKNQAQELKYKQKVIVQYNSKFVYAEFDFILNNDITVKLEEGRYLTQNHANVHLSKSALLNELNATHQLLLSMLNELPD